MAPVGAHHGLADRWILSRRRQMVAACTRALETCRFDLYANAIHEFAWREYCDWYLELAKPVLWDQGADALRQRAVRRTLLQVLEILLRAAHPVMPFITESIWRELAPRLGLTGATIMLQPYPQAQELPADAEADAAIGWLKDIVTALRNIRGEAGIKPSQEVAVLLQGGGAQDRTLAEATQALVRRLAKATSLRWLANGEEPPPSALGLVGNLRVLVPLAGLIDLDAERIRLRKAVQRKQAELQRLTGKLGNPGFIANAPSAVVAKERTRAEDAKARLEILNAQLQSLV